MKMLELDPAALGQVGMYRFLISTIVPRPIAFISTISPEGIVNLAPFSFFNGVSSNPPCVMVSITRKSDGDKKDTLRNIEATRQFVLNTTPEWLAQQMNQCSAEYPYGVSELEKVGLTAVPSLRVKPPRIGESPVQMECELYETLEIGDGSMGSATIVVGKIVMAHVAESAWKDGKATFEELKPLSRLGGLSYGKTSDVFDLPRPKAE